MTNDIKTDVEGRMTPELMARTLEGIANALRDERMNVQPELDIIHLRQIADLLEKRQREAEQIEQMPEFQTFMANLRAELAVEQGESR